MYTNSFDDSFEYDRSVSDGRAKRYFHETLQRAEIVFTDEDLTGLKDYLRLPSDSTEDLEGILSAAIDIAEASAHLTIVPKIVREEFSQLPSYAYRKGYPSIYLLSAPIEGLYRFTNYSDLDAATIDDIWLQDPNSGIIVTPSTGTLSFRLCSTRQVVVDNVCDDYRIEYLAGYVPRDENSEGRLFEFRFSILPADIRLALRQIAASLYYQRGDGVRWLCPKQQNYF